MTQFLQKTKNKKKRDIKRVLWVKETEEIYQSTAMDSNSNYQQIKNVFQTIGNLNTKWIFGIK